MFGSDWEWGPRKTIGRHDTQQAASDDARAKLADRERFWVFKLHDGSFEWSATGLLGDPQDPRWIGAEVVEEGAGVGPRLVHSRGRRRRR
jgi:hypothetical protein